MLHSQYTVCSIIYLTQNPTSLRLAVDSTLSIDSMVFSPRKKQLCFDSSKYHVAPTQDDSQCIAPSGKGKRCCWDISKYELEEALDLEVEIYTNTSTRATNAVLCERLVLLRCCGDNHRQKLHANADCLAEVAALYVSSIKSGPPPSAPQKGRKSSQWDSFLQPAMLSRNGSLRKRWLLKTFEASLSTNVLRPMFVRYSKEMPPIRDELSKVVPLSYEKEGEVYAFIWPTHPGFVKIGYSKATAAKRIDEEWTECHPNPEIIWRIKVPFPQRMEKLIHLELGAVRRKIVVCQNAGCMRTHKEWFKATNEHVARVMDSWATICRLDKRYNARTRQFSTTWTERITVMGPAITSRKLLIVLGKKSGLRIEKDISGILASSRHGPVSKKGSETTTEEITTDSLISMFRDFMHMIAADIL